MKHVLIHSSLGLAGAALIMAGTLTASAAETSTPKYAPNVPAKITTPDTVATRIGTLHFKDGLTHLFVSPEDLLPVIALACLAGLRGPESGRWALLVLPVAWMTGTLVRLPLSMPAVTAIVTIAFGVLVAADRRLPVWMVISCAIALGLLHGNANGAELIGLGMAGVAVALFVLVALLAGQVATVRAAWARVVVRVAGSWIAAIGLLMLGWTAR